MRAEVLVCERYTVYEIARKANVHIATAWRWILRGVRGRKLDSIRIGGRRYVLKTDFEAFLSPDSTENAAPSPDYQARSDAAGKLLEAEGF